MNKFIVEFIGTFILVLTIGLCVISPNNVEYVAPIAISFALAVCIYAGGHVSGAHYNPAVSLAIFIRGKCSAVELIGFTVVQVISALIASFVVCYLKGEKAIMALTKELENKNLDIAPVFVAEFIFTFLLVWVILNVATSKGTSRNSFYGFAIGGVVLVGAYAVGPISGGAFNPAVVFGIASLKLISWSSIWVYLLATYLGAIAAAFTFKAFVKE